MPRPPTQIDRKTTLELLEEAVHLLRRSPAAVGMYYLGAMPFVLAVLYFIADAGGGATSQDILAESLGLAIAFAWMKAWQSLAAAAMLAGLCMEPPTRRSAPALLKLLAWQTFIHSLGLVLLPVAAATVFAFPRAYAFWQNASVLATGDGAPRMRKALGEAWTQSGLAPQVNWALGAIMTLLALVIFVNIFQAILIPPELGKTYLDIDSVFSRGGFNPLNSTFLSIIAGGVYLCLDPVIKAFYTLRCFYGRSRQTGQDLRSQLREVISASAASLVIAAVAMFAAASPAAAQEAAPAGPAPASVSPQGLGNAIDKTLSGPQYRWRTPPDKSPQASWGEALADELARFTDWLHRLGRKKEEPATDKPMNDWQLHSGEPTAGLLQVIVYILLGVCVAAIAVVIVQHFRNRSREDAATPATEAPAVDLSADEVAADQLPQDQWWQMAQDLLAKGDRRTALRAMYLASLAMLGEHGLIRIARFKSNREYRRELDRRAHALGEVVLAFGQNVSYFEDAWYGLHEVTDEVVRLFCQNYERIRRVGPA